MYVYIYVYMYICIYVYIYTYIYMKLFAYLKQNKNDPPEFEARETMIKINQRIGVCVLAVVQDQINSSQAKARSKQSVPSKNTS